jgi:hypothetical protein
MIIIGEVKSTYQLLNSLPPKNKTILNKEVDPDNISYLNLLLIITLP